MRLRSLAHCLWLALLLDGAAQAQTQTPFFNPVLWGLCPADPLAAQLTPYTGVDSTQAPIQFSAEHAESTPGEARLEGDVEVVRGDQHLQAGQVRMDREKNIVTAQGEVRYGDPRIAIRSQGAEVELDKSRGHFTAAEYYLAERNAQGKAADVRTDRNSAQSQLQQVTYSTCPRGNEFWMLRTERLELDEKAGRGKAWNITVLLLDKPVAWLPYLSFPINEQRQSGFLAPRTGFDDDNGFDLRVPYYWNIAPEQDATIAPRILSERGVQLGLEYRFLTPQQRGEIDLEYLPDDQKFGDDRSAIMLQHQANFLPGLYTDLLYQEVSDDDYLKDLDNNLDLLSPTYLERRLDARYYGGNWNLLARLQNFQTIDEELFAQDRPYGREPQLLLNAGWDLPAGLALQFSGELVHFSHDEKITGTRLDLQPTLSLPLEWPWGFVDPRLGYRYTGYDLSDPVQSGGDDRPTRGAPIFSLDSGLFFERPVSWSWFGGDAIQTLEPRLFYLYVPFRNQDDIPIFDTAEIDRSYPWLFLENRFVGADRLGDANQITAALTTRLLSPSDGRERLRLSLGQIYYFEDPEVALTPGAELEQGESALIAEAMLRVSPSISLRGALQWDSDLNQTQRGAFDLRYQPNRDRIVNVAYRYAEERLEQTDLALWWRLNPQWSAIGRWNYSLQDERNIDLFAGFEYGDCCWALRMLARQHRSEPEDEEAKNSVYLELELKGLGGVGHDVTGLMEDTILGYERTRY
ncbi:MAG TPA: LPS assembly protein LptD [Candidatus Competibacteraceae bacterium]|nr:LPS assembly protein LptD [Candidatus Competibacteraceae bacterium]